MALLQPASPTNALTRAAPLAHAQRAACECLSELGLPYRLRVYDSGVIVVQGASQQVCGTAAAPWRFCSSLVLGRALPLVVLLPRRAARCHRPLTGAVYFQDEAVFADINEALKASPWLTASRLAARRGTSVVVAQQQLLEAEKAKHVCRDDTVEGLRFYANRFLYPEGA